MAETSQPSGAKSKRRRRIVIALILIPVLLVTAYFSFVYYFPYSEGTRTGVLRKLSHKGFVFKTWEGELQMSGVNTHSDTGQIIAGGTVWTFSAPEDDALIAKLREFESRGTRVTLHYKEYLRTLAWRGDTKYFVTAANDALAPDGKPAATPTTPALPTPAPAVVAPAPAPAAVLPAPAAVLPTPAPAAVAPVPAPDTTLVAPPSADSAATNANPRIEAPIGNP